MHVNQTLLSINKLLAYFWIDFFNTHGRIPLTWFQDTLKHCCPIFSMIEVEALGRPWSGVGGVIALLEHEGGGLPQNKHKQMLK